MPQTPTLLLDIPYLANFGPLVLTKQLCATLHSLTLNSPHIALISLINTRCFRGTVILQYHALPPTLFLGVAYLMYFGPLVLTNKAL